MSNKNYALITGASQGLGKAFAFECAERQIKMVLVALPHSGLYELADFIKKNYSVKTICIEKDLSSEKNCIELYNEIKDWRNDIKFSHTKSKDSIMKFIGIGWGDKGFYLDTPKWSDLKVSTAFYAATGLSTTAMHTTFYKTLEVNENCKKIQISKENYKKLVVYITQSFQRNTQNKTINIPNNFYGQNDSFYEANGKYSILKTCNTWANGALKQSDQKAAFWTPYDGGIFCHYK